MLHFVLQRLDDTARGQYAGGDTAWEESHRLDYQRSELRLIEIQEKICEGIGRGEDQVKFVCYWKELRRLYSMKVAFKC
jgi:hypothetical protein